MAKQQTSVRNRTNVDLREPRRYKVIIYNDDFTTMEFVVHILHSIFYKTPSEAEALMLTFTNGAVPSWACTATT